MAGGFRVDGVPAVVKGLQGVGDDVVDLKDGFASIAEEAEQRVESLTPKRTGRLARSVRGSRLRSKAVVVVGGASVPHAGPINYGWPARNITGAGFLQQTDRSLQPRSVQLLENDINRSITQRGLA